MITSLLKELRATLISIKLKLYAATIIKNKNVFGYTRPYIAYHSICFIVDQVFYKLALSDRSTVRAEMSNYLILKDRISESEILPKMIFHDGSKPYFSSNVLYPIAKKEYFIAFEVLFKKLSKYGEFKSTKISSHKNLVTAFKLFKTSLSSEKYIRLENLAQSILSQKLSIGLTHGDFYSSNIMKDENGNFVMIDFDCVEVEGVQEFDLFKAMIVNESREQAKTWKEIIIEVDNKWLHSEKYKAISKLFKGPKSELLFLYFLNCIGTNYDYYNDSFDVKDDLNYEIIDYFLEYCAAKAA
jgi:hypothetical protein